MLTWEREFVARERNPLDEKETLAGEEASLCWTEEAVWPKVQVYAEKLNNAQAGTFSPSQAMENLNQGPHLLAEWKKGPLMKESPLFCFVTQIETAK